MTGWWDENGGVCARWLARVGFGVRGISYALSPSALLAGPPYVLQLLPNA